MFYSKMFLMSVNPSFSSTENTLNDLQYFTHKNGKKGKEIVYVWEEGFQLQ